jgi:hypothetical protein
VVASEDSATGVAAATDVGLVCVEVRTALTHGHDHGSAAMTVGSLEDLSREILEQLVAA